MLDGNVLLRQKRDEVPKGTLSCPDRIMEVFYQLRHYEGSHLLPSVCGQKLILQTLIDVVMSPFHPVTLPRQIPHNPFQLPVHLG